MTCHDLGPYGLDTYPLVRVESDECSREDAVLLLEDVLAQQTEDVQQTVRPGRVFRGTPGGLTQHLLDLAMIRAQRLDVIGEFVCHLRKQTLFLDHDVRSKDNKDLSAALGNIHKASTRQRAPEQGDLRSHVVMLAIQLGDGGDLLAPAVLTHSDVPGARRAAGSADSVGPVGCWRQRPGRGQRTGQRSWCRPCYLLPPSGEEPQKQAVRTECAGTPAT